MDIAGILRETPLFEGLNDEQLAAVTKCVVASELEPGTVVIEEGATAQSLYLVQSGTLKVEKESKGKKVVLAELGEGDAFGEMGLLEDSPTSATVTAAEKTELLAISRLDLNVLLSWDTILASRMWRSFALMLSTRLRDMNDKVLEKYGAEAIQG